MRTKRITRMIERDRDRQTDRQTGKQTDRDRQTKEEEETAGYALPIYLFSYSRDPHASSNPGRSGGRISFPELIFCADSY